MITNSTLGQQGRLGNQLFQYAFLFAQARRLRSRAFVNVDAPGFALNPYALDTSGTVSLVSAEDYGRLYRQEIRSTFAEPAFQYSPAAIAAGDRCDYHGYFQSDRYFHEVSPQIRVLFTLDEAALGAACRPWIRRIRSNRPDVVAVHVRRGDYLRKPKVHTNLHDTAYYQTAIDCLKRRLMRPVMAFVFSDDIDWCRRAEPVRGVRRVRYVSGLDAYGDLYLQTLCDHHVIANSSVQLVGCVAG